MALALMLAGPPAAHAVQPDEMLADPALETRARDISRELRCVVCQNESIDESDADLARDLRLLVRQRLKAGDSDRQVTDYVVSRYGEFVLLEPPFKPETYLLWFGPAIVLGCGALALVLFYRRRARLGDPAAAPLDAADEQRIRRLVEGRE